jgi:hypothetical protein
MKYSIGSRLYLWPSYRTLGFIGFNVQFALANPEGLLCLAGKG